MKVINGFFNFLIQKAPSSKWLLWLFVAAVFKLPVFYLLLAKNGNGYEGSFMLFNSDTPSYFDPIKNLISNGAYYDAATEGYRLPGYGIFYFLFQFLFHKAFVFNLIGVLQLICSILSVYVLGLLAVRFTNNIKAFYVSFFIYALSPFTSVFNSYLLTESFSASFLVFGFYFLYSSVTTTSLKPTFISGLLFTWSYFLRPSLFVLMPLLVLFLLILVLKKQIRLKHFFVFVMPAIICSGLWMIHNYNSHKKIALLTHTLYYPKIEKTYMKSAMRFFDAYGYPQVIMPFTENNKVFYYLNFPDKSKIICVEELETHCAPSFNKDSVINLVNLVNTIEKDTLLSPLNKEQLDKYVSSKFTQYRSDLIASQPYFYYVTTELKIMRQYFSIEASGYSPSGSTQGIKQKIAGLLINLYCYFHYLIVTLGCIGAVVMALTLKKQTTFFHPFTGIATIILLFSIPLLMRLGETRYIVPAYPLLILCLTNLIVKSPANR